MFLEGKDIDAIATERELRPITICGHLARCVINRRLDIASLIPAEDLEKLQAIFDGKEFVTYEEVSILAEKVPFRSKYPFDIYWRIYRNSHPAAASSDT